jgi:hypothetical protein
MDERAMEEQGWERAHFRPRALVDDVLIPGIGRLRLQLAFDGTYEPGACWDIRQREAEWRIFRSEVTGVAVGDLPLLLGYEELDAPGELLRGYFDRLRALAMPVGPPVGVQSGRDGTVYHLALFGDLLSNVRYRWWQEGPAQWRPLIAIADEMIQVFRRLGPRAG